MEKTEILQNKLGSIKRGAYWFEVFGKAGYGLSALYFIFLLVKLFSGDSGASVWEVYGLSAVKYCIFGYLAFRVRDAFRSIEELIREIGEIV